MPRVAPRTVSQALIAAVLLTAACKRQEPPSFEIVDDPRIDVPSVKETVPVQKAPDLTEGMLAREAAAAIDARLSVLRRRELATDLDGVGAVITAFIDSTGVRMVREHPAAPGAHGPNARYYFRDDELLYYESSMRTGSATSPSRGYLRTVIGFDGHRGAMERTRTMDGTPAKIDGASVDSVLARADRILDLLAAGSPPR